MAFDAPNLASARPTADRTRNERSQTTLRVRVGGPVGSGKTALMEQLCERPCRTLDIAAITNDI